MTTIFLRAMRSAISALAFTAMACGGNDPPGGGNGNGDTSDGGETPGSDGHVPDPSNPLIAVLPGTWTVESYESVEDGKLEREVPNPPEVGPLTVDTRFPNCYDPNWQDFSQDPSVAFCEGWERSGGVVPGDACICMHGIVSVWVLIPHVLVLDGDAVRMESSIQRHEGRVLDGGRSMRITVRNIRSDDTLGEGFTANLRKLE